MNDGFEKVTLANLAKGAAVERFDAELARVLDNIADINTKCKSARTITLTVKIVPTEDRAIGAVDIGCSSKLASMSNVEHTLHLSQEGRRQIALQRTDTQNDLGLDNVKPIGAGAHA